MVDRFRGQRRLQRIVDERPSREGPQHHVGHELVGVLGAHDAHDSRPYGAGVALDDRTLDPRAGREQLGPVGTERPLVLPVVEQRGCYRGHGEPVHHLQPQLVTVLTIVVFVVTADGLQHAPADHGARAMRGLVEDHRVLADPPAVLDAQVVALLIYVDVARVYQGDVVVRVEIVAEDQQRVLVEIVVGVQSNHVLTTRQAQRFVRPNLKAGGLLVTDRAHPLGITRFELRGDRRCIVGRAVVDDDELPVGA